MADYTTSLLAALNCKDAVHLIIGSNPLAAARCTQSLAAGATPLVIAPATANEIHYGLQKHFNSGVKWLNRKFQDEDLVTLGREEIDRVVDAVFVSSGPRDAQSELLVSSESEGLGLTRQRCTHISPLQAEKNPRQCGRCASALHLYAPLNTHRWSPASRRDDQR